MGGRRSRRHRGGRPPPPQFMPGATAPPVYAEGGRGRRSRRHRGGRPPPPQFMPGATAPPVYAEGGRMPYEVPPPPVYEEGGGRSRRSRGGKTRKASPWNLFVKKIYGEMKRKHGKGASFSDALKEASRRKKEM